MPGRSGPLQARNRIPGCELEVQLLNANLTDVQSGKKTRGVDPE